MKRFPLKHLSFILALLAALAAFAWYYTNANEPVDAPPVAAPESQAVPATKDACEQAGGVWNECASACPPDAEACIQMCVQRCEFPELSANSEDGAVRLYFTKISQDARMLDCNAVHPVSRVLKEQAGADAALRELLRGITKQEESDGYNTSFPAGVSIRSQRLSGDTYYVDFSKELHNVAGSCRVQSIRAQIEATVKAQAPQVKNVVISIEGGDPDEALQP